MKLLSTIAVLLPLLISAAPVAAVPIGAVPIGAGPVQTDGVATLAADSESAWVAFDLTPGNQMRFAMTVDGKPVTAILDTGVSYSVMARKAADPARVRKGGSATAIGGSVAIGWLPTRTMTIGGLTRRGGGVSVADLPAIATGSAVAVDMLVGRDVTGGQALDIDYANRRFRLLPSGRMPFRGMEAPLTISTARRVYESAVSIGGKRLAPMVVDTGDGSAITLSAPAWASAGLATLPTTTALSFGLAGPTVNTLAIIPEVRLGETIARQVETRIEPANGFSQSIGVAGRIGTGFLQRYRVLLDPMARRMVLQPGPGVDAVPLRSTSGILVGILSDRLRVLHVMRGGPAAAAGWREGETICRIDDMPIDAAYATGPLAAWSIRAPGTVVKLTMCGGETRALTLARFY